jgi:hypothetical protein
VRRNSEHPRFTDDAARGGAPPTTQVAASFGRRNAMSQCITRAFALASIAFVSACGGGDKPNPVEPITSSFTANVSGATTATLTGLASFVSTTQGFGLTLASAAADGSAITFVRAGGAPAAGTYALGANPLQPGDFVALYTGGSTAFYGATAGTLTVSSISANSMRGSFTFTAKGGNTGTATVTVTGSFDAHHGNAQ